MYSVYSTVIQKPIISLSQSRSRAVQCAWAITRAPDTRRNQNQQHWEDCKETILFSWAEVVLFCLGQAEFEMFVDILLIDM